MAANVGHVELWLSFNNAYQLTLSIPATDCHRFSVHPLAWLRYLAYTIYGAQGYISRERDGEEVDYHSTADLSDKYFYVSEGSCLLLDPDMMVDRTSNASDITIGRGTFKARVVARDTNCVMTGPALSQACHIIPHAKGNNYLENLIAHRNEIFEPPLVNINDTRNGILLAFQLHPWFGASDAAFLQTPNFAMAVTDVGLIKQPAANQVQFFAEDPSHTNRRLTFQHFNVKDSIVQVVAPHNSDAKRSDSNEWPPPLMFDVSYGCAALKTWGVPYFKQFARQLTRNTYYNGDDDNDHAEDDDDDDGGGRGGAGGGGGGGGGSGSYGGGGGAGGGGGGGSLSEGPRRSKSILNQPRNFEAAKRTKARTVGRPAGNTEDGQAGNIADMVMALWMQNAKKRPHQAHSIGVDSPGEKVRAWLESAE